MLYPPNITEAVMICGVKTQLVVFALIEKKYIDRRPSKPLSCEDCIIDDGFVNYLNVLLIDHQSRIAFEVILILCTSDLQSDPKRSALCVIIRHSTKIDFRINLYSL